MHVGIDGAAGENVPLRREHFGRRADHEVGRDAVHDAGVAGLADRRDAAIADSDIRLADAGAVDDHRVGDDEIGRPGGTACGRRLPHAVADDFAAAELRFVAVGGGVLFNLDDQIGVGQAYTIAGGRTEMVGVGAAVDLHAGALAKAVTACSAASRTCGSSSGPSTS